MWFWLFVVSFLLNILALFYIRWLLKVVATINQDIENLTALVNEFVGHIQSVYELEMFYGDDTLKSLMKHGRQLSDTLLDLDLILNQEEEQQLAEEKEKKEN